MAARRKPRTRTHEQVIDVSTADIVRAAWDDPARLIPCLWGPPRRGKTWTLLQLARERTGAADRVIVWRPALDLPEDMGGLIRVRGGRGYYSTPPGIPQQCLDDGGRGWALIIDEIDKAPHETLCTMLSLLDHQRAIRGHRLPNLLIACAGNQPDMPLPEPLIGRMLHLSFPARADVAPRVAQYDDMSARQAAPWLPSVTRLVLERGVDSPLPERVSGDDSLSALLSWRQWSAAHDPGVLQRLVQGLFASTDVPAVLAALDRDELTDEDHLGRWIDTAPVGVVMARLHQYVAALPPGAAQAAVWRLSECSRVDATGEMAGTVAALLSCDVALAALGPASPARVSDGVRAWSSAPRTRGELDPRLVAAHKCGHVCRAAESRRAMACGGCGGACQCSVCDTRRAWCS
jgi:hypothetical protein